MKKFRSYTPGDDEEVLDGDNQFLGVNMRLDPAQVPAGYASEAVNKRFDDGVAATRRGLRLLSWSNKADASNPSLIKPFDDGGTPKLYGAGLFNDSTTNLNWLIVAAGNGMWRCREGNGASQVPLPSGETITGRVQLIQAANKMILLRGPDLAPLYMDDLDVGFKYLPAPSGSNLALPKASVGVWFQNRLWVVVNRDELWVSLFLDPLQGPTVRQLFRISQGESEEIVGLYPFSEQTLVAAKRQSVYVLTDLLNVADALGDDPLTPLLTGMRQYPLTREYGCAAARSFAAAGADVWFLAPGRGVSSVRQTEQNKLQGVDVPVSRDVQPIIDQINWAYAGAAVGTFHGNRYYLAVPWGASTLNNIVLVFNTLNGSWEGYDTLPSATEGIKDWVKIEYAGTIRLGFVSERGFVYLYEDGFLDDLADNSGNVTLLSIPDTLVTRGYVAETPGFKQGVIFRAALSTWWPKYSVAVQMDGMEETNALITDKTRSRTAYYKPWDKAAYDVSNVNDDHATANRQDYSIALGAADSIYIGASGLDFDRHQQIHESRTVPAAGRYLQLKFTNSQGRLEVRSVMLSAIADSRRQGVKA